MTDRARKKLKELSRKQLTKYVLIFLFYEMCIVASYLIYYQKTGERFTDPVGFFWILFMMIPFAFKLHKRIFEPAWRGEVKIVRDPKNSQRQAYILRSYKPGFLIKNKGYEVRVVDVFTYNKGYQEIILVGDEANLADNYYHPHDRVERLPGLRYPINCTSERDEIFCPVCGHFNKKGEKRCYACKNKLVDIWE